MSGFWSYAIIEKAGEYEIQPRHEVPWQPCIIVEGEDREETHDRALWLAALINTYGAKYAASAA